MKKLRFFYIYLNQKILRGIETDLPYKRIASEKTGQKKFFPEKNWFGRLVLRAAVTSILVYFTVVYLHQGKFTTNADGSSVFNKIMLVEASSTFVFLMLVFLAHRFISHLMSRRPLLNLNPLLRAVIEALLVIISSLILLYLTILIPFTLVFPEVEITAERVRFNNIFMAILTLFFYYFVERERSKKQLQAEMLRSARLQKENFEAQLQNLKNQVNPHFLFNSLNVLSSLINIDREKATEFTSRLSDVYRSFLDNSEKELVSLKEELEVVSAYNYLLKTRFGEAITFHMNITAKPEEYFLPPGALQTLIENAVKHNGSTLKEPLQIDIYTEKEELIVVNKLKPRAVDSASTGSGLKNLLNRYKYLTDRKPRFEKTRDQFTAKLPLLKL